MEPTRLSLRCRAAIVCACAVPLVVPGGEMHEHPGVTAYGGGPPPLALDRTPVVRLRLGQSPETYSRPRVYWDHVWDWCIRPVGYPLPWLDLARLRGPLRLPSDEGAARESWQVVAHNWVPWLLFGLTALGLLHLAADRAARRGQPLARTPGEWRTWRLAWAAATAGGLGWGWAVLARQVHHAWVAQVRVWCGIPQWTNPTYSNEWAWSWAAALGCTTGFAAAYVAFNPKYYSRLR